MRAGPRRAGHSQISLVLAGLALASLAVSSLGLVVLDLAVRLVGRIRQTALIVNDDDVPVISGGGHAISGGNVALPVTAHLVRSAHPLVHLAEAGRTDDESEYASSSN